MHKLLVVDDNEDVRRQLKWGLSKGPYELVFAQDGQEGLKLFHEVKPNVVTLDLGLPPHENGTEEGLRTLREMLRINPYAKIIVITGNEDGAVALEAVEIGAYDYYKKPIDLNELKIIVARAFHLQGIENENRKLKSRADTDSGIIGQCRAMRQVYSLIDKVAETDAPVLITGESGTGKELVAKAIHEKSARKTKPMVSINCGAIPENLLESELFGHEKGAFTGASQTVKGKVEYADGGTLFLDEIGDLPLALQVKLLRFLQEMVIQRVGGRKDISVDVRIIAATNVDIEQAMREGRFREDLYYRIGVVNIMLPSLKDRNDDILLLANYFLKRMAEQSNSTVTRFNDEAADYMMGYDWPGNIRELENKVKRAVIMASGTEIMPDDLGFGQVDALRRKSTSKESLTLKEARSLLEREMVEDALERHERNIVQAATSIGVSRPTFYDLMKKHGIEA